MKRQALMLPLGEADFRKGVRTHFLSAVRPMLDEIGMDIGYELKGNALDPEGWINDLRDAQPEAQLVWHPGAGIAKTLGSPGEPIPPALLKCCQQAQVLAEKHGLRALTIHLAPALATDACADEGLERYEALVGAEEMLDHVERQIKALCQLVEEGGVPLSIETVDVTNFVDAGHKLPTYLALQTGSGRELGYIKEQVQERTGIELMITLDPEHVNCADNVFRRRRDMAMIPRWKPIVPTLAQTRWAEISGYWLEKGKVPYAAYEVVSELGRSVDDLGLFKPDLIHLGAAVEAKTDAGHIGTHLPYNPWDEDQMSLLEHLIFWANHNPTCIGYVIEVTGRRLSERYSTWSQRPDDDEVAKMMSLLVVIDRLKTLRTLTSA